MEQKNPSLRWLVVLALVWPMVVVGLSSGVSLMLSRRGEHKPDSLQTAKDSPAQVVQALWATQGRVIDDWRQMGRPHEFAAVLSKDAVLAGQQNDQPYSERQIDNERKLDADRWLIKATLTISPPYRNDEKRVTERREYIVMKDAGKWRVAEVRAECTSCDGKGYDSCFMCSGKGRDYDGRTCSECDGTGKLKCKICKGLGWTDLLRSPGGIGRY